MASKSVAGRERGGVEVSAAEVFKGIDQLLAQARRGSRRATVKKLKATLDYIERVDNAIVQLCILAGVARKAPVRQADETLALMEAILTGKFVLPRPIPVDPRMLKPRG